LAAFRDIIRLLDVPPKQVLIKVEFIDVSVNDLNSFGITWNIQPAGNIAANLPGGGTGASAVLAYSSGNAVATLRAALTRSVQNIIQSPIVTTVNNGIGAVIIQDSVPTVVTQQIVTGNGNVVSNTQPIAVPVFNTLIVQPRINGDNSVFLTVQPTLSAVDITTGPGGVPLIRSTSRTVVATRRIQNGETMVLGGFITRQQSDNENRVPILADLPIIGGLFRAREQRTVGTETLVFLTPTIIEDAATGTTGAVSVPPTP
jgi:general secretion pathway protein D